MTHEPENEGNKAYHIPKGEDVVLPEQQRFVRTTAGERGGKEHRSVYEPLMHYHASRLLNDSGNEHVGDLRKRAGENLFRLWMGSGMGEKYVTMRFGEPYRGESVANGVDVAREYLRACEAIQNANTRNVVKNVCLFGEWAGAGNMIRLKEGLDSLVEHFRLR